MKNNKIGLAFILPSFIGLLIFLLIPFIDVIIRSFQSVVTREFVGLANYKEIFSNGAFKLASKNTCRFVFVCIPLLLLLSLSIAVLIQRFVSNSKLIRTALFSYAFVILINVILTTISGLLS